MRCPLCATHISQPASFCPICGAPLTSDEAAPQTAQQADPDQYVGKTCPFCRFPIKPGESITVCPDCGIPHHQDCWEQNAGCATYGCNGATTIPTQMPPPATSALGPEDEPIDPTGCTCCIIVILSPLIILISLLFRHAWIFAVGASVLAILVTSVYEQYRERKRLIELWGAVFVIVVLLFIIYTLAHAYF